MLNKVTFIGHLGRDPETRYMTSGVAVSSFSVASTEKWKDKSTGEQKEETEWLRCSAFDKLAEIVGQYLKKGSLVYVEGALKTRKYTDSDGIEKFSTECRVTTMKMLGGRPQGDDYNAGGQQSSRAPAQRPAPSEQGGRAARPAQRPAPNFADMDDDIPF